MLESGMAAKVDYVSHPLDKAPVPELEAGPTPVKRRTSSTKKTPGSSAPARVKVEKPAATRKKAANPTPRKPSTTGASIAKPRLIMKKTLADEPSADISAPPADVIQGIEAVETLAQETTERADVDSDSELSELAITPRCPTPISNERTETFHKQVQLENPEEVDFTVPASTLPTTEDVQPDTPVAAESEILAAPASPPIQTYGSGVTTNALREIYSQSPPQVTLTATGSDSAILPITPASLRQSGRSRAQPKRFGSPVPVPVEVDAAEGQDVAEEDITKEKDETVSGGDSPIAQKVSRNANSTPVAKPARRKKPVSQEKLSREDLAEDVPAVKSRKRKAETAATTTPRKRPTKAKGTTVEASEVKVRKTPVQRKTPAQRKKKEKTPITKALQLPSPAMSQSDYLEVSGLPIDPELLQLSRDLTHRKPLDSKPESRGRPEIWAPGRQELCETLPYFKSAHSGCYSNGNTVYAFMFDSVGVGREYMDQDVIIARMGGHMETDRKTGLVTQKDDHKMEAKQPQSVLNNVAHNNPIIIGEDYVQEKD
jgi:hypothetical protein